jgi:hypothetical protein
MAGHSRADPDRILVTRLQGTATRHAQWRDLTGAEHAAAVAKLRELAGGLADLLAEVAGTVEGFYEGKLNEPLMRQVAQLCRDAGAEPAAIPAWVEEGRRRTAAAGPPPFSRSRQRPPGIR